MIAVLAVATAMSGDFALSSGDRVVFYGDSITQEQNADYVYPDFVEAYVVTRYPDRDIRFFNLGWPGDATWGGEGGASDLRVKRDVAPVHPTVVTIMLGMNDAGYVAFDPKIEAIFKEWYGKLLGWMKDAAPNARYSLIQTSPYDSITRDPARTDPFTSDMIRLPYNSVLLRFGEVVKEMASARGYAFVDFNKPVLDLLTAAKAANPEAAPLILPDGIHPATPGHAVMAAHLLASWNASALVSDVEIDASAGKVLKSEHATISKLSGLSWTCSEGSLPYPLPLTDPNVRVAVEHTDLLSRVGVERLAVKGLAAGTYRLEIDGKKVGEFAADKLASGIELGACETPMMDQAMKVLDLAKKRNHLFFVRRHDLQWALDGIDTSKACAALDALAEEVRKAELAAARPSSHRFTLTALPGS
ncbi:MAG TPA: SGNH/GDSL hydrolase family protein [Fimbriimonadaceae bacterium]|nr:SGNH/GDSL hydrolase family protein [Fimbriimonadaceae bacterium]